MEYIFVTSGKQEWEVGRGVGTLNIARLEKTEDYPKRGYTRVHVGGRMLAELIYKHSLP